MLICRCICDEMFLGPSGRHLRYRAASSEQPEMSFSASNVVCIIDDTCEVFMLVIIIMLSSLWLLSLLLYN